MSDMQIGTVYKANNVIALAQFKRPVDSAVSAKMRVDAAGDDDAAYGQAMAQLETARPTTLQGVLAQSHAMRLYFNGDTLTAEGWAGLFYIWDGIDQALERFVARTAEA
jgi:hypothetical protein